MLVADRDAADTSDVFRCLRAADGEELWRQYDRSPADLDYGNSARATPQVYGDLVLFSGAMGRLLCVELATGTLKWRKDLRKEFKVDEETSWGLCSSPLVVDDMLIVNPGGKDAALVALRPATGEVIWQTPGQPAAFGSLIVGVFGGQRQIVGYDKTTLGGWDVQSGKRLWTLKPPRAHDFNVPTPIAVEGKLLVATENNGTRLYQFDNHGAIVPEPLAENLDLAPDTHTPVVVGNRCFGVWSGFYCLDIANGLKPAWKADDQPYFEYASIIASPERLLITTQRGELLLVDAQAEAYRVLSRLSVFADEQGVYSHPALLGSRLYIRGSSEIGCLDLQP